MSAAAAKRRAASDRRGPDASLRLAHDSTHRGLTTLRDHHATARTSRRPGRGVFRPRSYPQILLKTHFSKLKNMSMEDHAEFVLEMSTGWVRSLRHTRRISLEGGFQQDDVTIVRKQSD